MNPLLNHSLKTALLLSAVFALPSCETVPGSYVEDPGGYGYGSSYVSSGPAYVGGSGYYASRPYYGGGYYNSDYYRRNGGSYYNRGRDYDRHDHDHDNDWNRNRGRDNDRDRKDNSGAVRMTKYRQDGDGGDLPSGYHDKEWFQKRGYSISKNDFETRDGSPRGRADDKKDGKRDGKKR